MATLFTPPPVYGLPLSKGGDLLVNFRNKVPDSDPPEYEDYPVGVALLLVIDTAEPVEAEAEISGSVATVRVESEVVDTIPKGKLWRCVYQMAGSPTTEIIVANGLTERHDGRG